MFQVASSNAGWPSNFIKQHQPRWPNRKMFAHQTKFNLVQLPNISRVDSALMSTLSGLGLGPSQR